MDHAMQVILIQMASLQRRKMTIINIIFVISWDILRKIAQNVGNGLKEKVNIYLKVIFLYVLNQT